MYTYAWYHWITFFYLYCFFGWIFESTYVSFKQHHFVNRGFLRLPMLPLYGSGAILLLWVSLPYQDNLIYFLRNQYLCFRGNNDLDCNFERR